ncbi:MAG: hypothetical protein K0S29_330 [Gammaproteobacteria bacterium]|jgi:dTDP-4-dehydrorhamnose reductase|nr:hypothetical protein [Gammaproteobacteria bacterium]
MKILLLGANGQLGADIVKYQQSHKQANQLSLQCFTRSNLDISKPDLISRVLEQQDFDVLINCMAYTQVDKAETEIDLAFTINAYAVEQIALACQKKHAKLIHISTDFVFGGYSANKPLNEQAPTAPINIYGQSKLLGEELALASCQNSIILRSASLFGLNQSKAKGNFVETMIRLGKENGKIKVIADQVMSPTGTFDLAKMIFQALEANIPSGIYHAVNSGQASWYEFACKIMEMAKIDCEINPIPAIEYPLPAKRPSYSVLDNHKLSRLIGPISHWHQALAYYFQQSIA